MGCLFPQQIHHPFCSFFNLQKFILKVKARIVNRAMSKIVTLQSICVGNIVEIQHIPGNYRWKFTVVSIGSTMYNRFLLEFFEENELCGFCKLFFSFNGQSSKAFLFSPSFLHVFKQKFQCLIRKEKGKLAFFTVECLHLSVILFSISDFEGLGLAYSACGPESQDFWAHGSLVGRKGELCLTQ